jgi:hypothetical protein
MLHNAPPFFADFDGEIRRKTAYFKAIAPYGQRRSFRYE